MPGVEATCGVVRGGNRTVQVSVPLVCRNPGDGQVLYEITATATLIIPAGVSLPEFEPAGSAQVEELFIK